MTLSTAQYDDLFMPTPDGITAWLKSAKIAISEEGVIDFVARLSPWIAPLPSAFFVHNATIKHLATGNELAWIIAVVIETLGLTTTHTALSMFTWNKGHVDQDEKRAPFGLAVVLACVYILSTLILIGVLEVLPGLQNYAPTMFPVLAAVGAVNLAMRSTHNRRIREEREIITDAKDRQRQLEDEERALRHEERRLKMAAKYGLTVNSTVNLPVNNGVNLTGNDRQSGVNDGFTDRMTVGRMNKIDARRARLLTIVAVEPGIELTELQRRLGLGSVNTIKGDIAALEGQGRLTFKDRRFKVTP